MFAESEAKYAVIILILLLPYAGVAFANNLRKIQGYHKNEVVEGGKVITAK